MRIIPPFVLQFFYMWCERACFVDRYPAVLIDQNVLCQTSTYTCIQIDTLPLLQFQFPYLMRFNYLIDKKGCEISTLFLYYCQFVTDVKIKQQHRRLLISLELFSSVLSSFIVNAAQLHRCHPTYLSPR